MPAPLRAALSARGYTEATPVQQAVLAEGPEGDLLVSSQTGSGKTLAFGLALAPLLFEGDRFVGAANRARPRVIVVAPTRELALQVARELGWLYAGARARVATCVGGMDIRREQRALMAGADIVVGTPGRVIDHLERASLALDELSALVLDEADEMLDMGFRDELERILQAAPAERRTLMFSATLPRQIEALAKRYTKDARRVRGSAEGAAHADIEHLAHLVDPRERARAVVNVLRLHDAPTALVFCATRDGVAHLHGGLVERGFGAAALSGELSQAERNRAIHAVREGRARVLVATDVAARGLDLPAVGLVIHADLPHDSAVLQHRSGRTGRAGRKGTAVVLAPFPRRRQAERILRDAGLRVEWTAPPSAEQIGARDRERLLRDVEPLVAELEDEDQEIGRALLERHAPEAVAAALARTLRRSLPAAEELRLSAAPPRPSRADSRLDEARAGSARGGPDRDDGPRVEGVWFFVNVGREQRADPKWLVPMLCRRGGITKAELGRFEIGRGATRFEIHPDAAEDFARQAGQPDQKDPHIRITPEEGGGAPPPRRQGRRDGPPPRRSPGKGPKGRGPPKRGRPGAA